MITVLMGAPGAGKSTWVHKNKNPLDYIYNTEAVRTNPGIDVAAFMRYERIKAIEAAKLGLDIICDGTHTFTGHRIVWLTVARTLNLNTKLVIFDTPLLCLLQAQKERVYPAPHKVVIDHYRRFEIAKHLVSNEAWDEIELVVRGKDG
jgi:predicted kinase